MSLRPLALLAGAVLLTACGSTDPGPARAPSSTGATSPDPGGSTTGTDAFPVVVTRVGGIAGFDDRVSVEADGRATVTTERGPGEDCRVTTPTLDRIAEAAAALPTTPSVRPSTRRVSDEMTTAVQTALTAGPVPLGDAPSGSTTVFVELLADVTGASPTHALCEG